jgi:hypothetical protein
MQFNLPYLCMIFYYKHALKTYSNTGKHEA